MQLRPASFGGFANMLLGIIDSRFPQLFVDPLGTGLDAGGRQLLGEHQTAFRRLSSFPSFCSVGRLEQQLGRIRLAETCQSSRGRDAYFAILVAQSLLENLIGLRFGERGQTVHDVAPRLASRF